MLCYAMPYVVIHIGDDSVPLTNSNDVHLDLPKSSATSPIATAASASSPPSAIEPTIAAVAAAFATPTSGDYVPPPL
jgi:hypothetical protein